MMLLQATTIGDGSSIVLLIAYYLLLCYCVNRVAKEKGRKGSDWGLYALIFTPFFAILMLIAIENGTYTQSPSSQNTKQNNNDSTEE